jgi:hypothetical protein
MSGIASPRQQARREHNAAAGACAADYRCMSETICEAHDREQARETGQDYGLEQ